MTNVFCIFQNHLINEDTVEYWSYRVFHAVSLSEFNGLKLEGLADPWPLYDDEEEEEQVSALEWYSRYRRYIRGDKPIVYQGQAPSYEMVTEILKQEYHLNVIKYIH